MFKLSNLRKFTKDGWSYLSCDFDVTEIKNPFQEKTMWVAVEGNVKYFSQIPIE